ncbi:hypothetical protein [Natronobacterium texcoconense]|uniref:Uncharacterized protein n=1 Tax=Natronobacterium texcoconense TaxID=1095778 RepID=A0A1H1FDE1_NATTX|nr:hypothetical protein [Natronobacterium texcoconense]SDQ98804.1 hypothetical protein SAMN04489842_1917 [Natronobacterium texcoconense]
MTVDNRVETTEEGAVEQVVEVEDGAGDDSEADVEPRDRLEYALERARTEPRAHAVAVAGAVIVGLVFSWLHWIGLVLGGALVGLVSPTLPRALLGGVGFGVIVLAVFALTLGGSAVVVAGTTPIVYVALAAAIGLPLFGSLARLIY